MYNDFYIHSLALLFPCFLITTDFVVPREPPSFSREFCNLLSDPTASLHPPNWSPPDRKQNVEWIPYSSGHGNISSCREDASQAESKRSEAKEEELSHLFLCGATITATDLV